MVSGASPVLKQSSLTSFAAELRAGKTHGNLPKPYDNSKIDKNDYLNAMKKSPLSPKSIYKLIKSSLTDKTNDRELFMKGIDYSYYYEEID